MKIDSQTRQMSVPKRDFILLPLIMLATLLGLFVPAELASRALFPDVQVDSCAAPAAAGARHARPGCVSRTKTAEGPWAINTYNECGYRTPEPCGPTPAGALRVAVIGASTSAGYLTPYPNTMAAVAAATLTRRCGRPVEFQNLAAAGNYGPRLRASAAEAVALRPDTVVMLIAPIDFDKAAEDQHDAAAAPVSWNPFRQLKAALASSRLLYMETYFILQHDDAYVPLFLRSGEKPDFMRPTLPPLWQSRLREFDTLLGQIAGITAAAGVPTVLAFVPQRAEAALAASDRFGHAFDPEVLPKAIGAIARAHGVAFVDVTRAIAHDTPSDTLFYAMNGHPNGRGHALIADVLVRRLISPDMGPFGTVCTAP